MAARIPTRRRKRLAFLRLLSTESLNISSSQWIGEPEAGQNGEECAAHKERGIRSLQRNGAMEPGFSVTSAPCLTSVPKVAFPANNQCSSA